MLHEILCNGIQTGLGGENVNFLCKFPFQLFLLAHIQLGGFDGIQDLLGDVGILDGAELLAPVLVVEGNGGAVLHGPLEVVDGDVVAEGALGDGIVGKEGRAGEADPGSGGQQGHHVLRKDAVLAPMGLVGHDDDVVGRGDGRDAPLVELLNEGEDKAGVALELFDEVVAALGDVSGCLGGSQQTAVFEGVADLLVQLVPVGEDDEGGGAFKFAADLLGEEEHGVALAAALGVPEDAQLAVSQLALAVDLHGLVDT